MARRRSDKRLSSTETHWRALLGYCSELFAHSQGFRSNAELHRVRAAPKMETDASRRLAQPRRKRFKYTRGKRHLSQAKNIICPSHSFFCGGIDFLCLANTMTVTNLSCSELRDRISYAELQNLSDERLVLEVHCGNADAFAVIFKRFHRLV